VDDRRWPNQTEEGVVFYDAENPLAWMQAGEVVDLDEAA